MLLIAAAVLVAVVVGIQVVGSDDEVTSTAGSQQTPASEPEVPPQLPEEKAVGTVEPEAPEPAVEPAQSVDELYVQTVRRNAGPGGWEGTSDRELIGLGQATCLQLNSGESLQSIQLRFAALAANGEAVATAQEIGAVLGAGIAAYCPEHRQ